MTRLFKFGDVVISTVIVTHFYVVLSCGPTSFDLVHVGGSTSRHRHDVGYGNVRIASELEISSNMSPGQLAALKRDAVDARAERKRGARICRAGGP